MDREKFDETLTAFQRRVPFKPFTVALVNGDHVEIDYPGAMVVRDGLALFAGPGGVPHIFDHEGVAQFIGDLAHDSSDRDRADKPRA